MDARHPAAESAGAEGDFLLLFLSCLPLSTSRSRLVELAQYLSAILSTLFLFLLVTTSDRASLLERPLQSGFVGLLSSGIVITLVHYVINARRGHSASLVEHIPLTNKDEEDSQGGKGLLARPSSFKTWFVVMAAAIAIRIYMLDAMITNMQCAVPGVEAFLPVFIAARGFNATFKSIRQIGDSQSRSRLVAFFLSLLGTVIVSWASILASRLSSYPRSTVICPLTGNFGSWILITQCVGLFLDAWILVSIKDLLAGSGGHKMAVPRRAPLVVGVLFIFSALLIGVTAGAMAVLPQHRSIFGPFDWVYLRNFPWLVFVFVTMVLCSLRLVSCEWQPRDAPKLSFDHSLDIAIVLTGLLCAINTRTGSKNMDSALSSEYYIPIFPPFVLLFLGCMLYSFSTRYPSILTKAAHGRPLRFTLYFLFFLTACVFLAYGLRSTGNTPHYKAHPIDRMIFDAGKAHKAWSRQASYSEDLKGAVNEYKKRYKRSPPPGFDRWLSYARNRQAHVIDDFDTIEENLRPFWKFTPEHIRMRTKLLLSDTANDCAEISIRGGIAFIGRVIPTHRWMVEGIINMMKNFVQDLPDMDIAFNINDEPRVAVPYSTLQEINKAAADQEVLPLDTQWSPNRAASWDIPENATLTPITMDMWSFRQTFYEFGSVACSPDSSAKKYRLWDSSTLCNACFKDHSVGEFMRDWRYASDPCHQPDLANLHGFYLSPSAFRATHEMIPIFSQSRTGGFADILYPSAWNYNDKIKYAPSDEYPDKDFPMKENTLFWRGTATEGYSNRGTWKGQVRQRMVHLANNSTAKAPVLFPSETEGYDYKLLTTSEVAQEPLLRSFNFTGANFSFVDMWPRCADGDCEAQDAEFGLAPPTDFQQHWRYRYLMDADGAAFSGRFLPFLQSNSVPFKTGIFREWYDSRIVAWKHFVPVDVRLHGLWSTLAYFAGEFGVRSQVQAGLDPAHMIASDGQSWAETVLRKEDMEIYFYRLLLEYARLTDDRREHLGFG